MISHHAVLLSVAEPLTFVDDVYTAVPMNAQFRTAQLSIDMVRTLITEAYRTPEGADEIKVLFIATEFITEEAQQALLKIVEEPPQSTRFVFAVPHGYGLLPTLESRFERVAHVKETVPTASFAEFKNRSVAERMQMIEENVKRKDHLWQGAVKKGLLSYLETESRHLPLPVMKELEYVARMLLTRGASNKFLLEHLALTLPA